MKRTTDVILAAVGFLLVAILVAITIKYFNRGTDVVTKNAEGVLSAAEGGFMGVVDFEKYDKKPVQGSTVISIIESLKNTDSQVRILVYTNGKKTVAEYTNIGAIPKDKITPPATPAATAATGNYREKKDDTYINPTLTYTINCHYTDNKTVDYVTIMQD